MGIWCIALLFADGATAATKIRVGWCTSVLTTGVVPFAVATKLGWFEQEGVEVEIVNFGGSSDCVRNVATGEVLVAVPSPEPVANLSLQGVETRIFYTAFRRNIFGIAVPVDSEIQTYSDLRGKKIGVTSMASTGVLVARAAAATAGLDPDTDITIVVSGQPAQTAVLLRNSEIDAVSQWDTNYAMIERAGVPMRMMQDEETSRFPSNSFVALQQTLTERGDLLGRFARAYTLGAIYSIRDPRSAVEMFHEVYPQVVPTGVDADTAVAQRTELLETVVKNWELETDSIGWGESIVPNYQSYFDWLVRFEVLPQPVDATTIVTNELVPQINTLDISLVDKALADNQ
jgi:NitT/TauT family transport system substrate-binding protein